jgi:hypothetical protein
MRISTLQWVAKAVRLPIRVFLVVPIRATARVAFAVAHAGFARTRSGSQRDLKPLVDSLEDHAGAWCVDAWWVSHEKAAELGSSEPVIGILIRDRGKRN